MIPRQVSQECVNVSNGNVLDAGAYMDVRSHYAEVNLNFGEDS